MDTVAKVSTLSFRYIEKKKSDPPKKRECEIKRKLMHKKRTEKNTVQCAYNGNSAKLIPQFIFSRRLLLFMKTHGQHFFLPTIACRTRKRRRKFKCENFVAFKNVAARVCSGKTNANKKQIVRAGCKLLEMVKKVVLPL